MVSSDQMFEFVKESSQPKYHIDKDGDVRLERAQSLEGEALATAIGVVAQLAAAEATFRLQQQELDFRTKHRTFTGGGEAMAN